MSDEHPSPPDDEALVPLEAVEPVAEGWPGFPPADETPAPWATAAAPAAPPPAPARRLWVWVAVGVGLQALALLLWAYFIV